MKQLSILILMVLCPLLANGHPGKTDRHGGHKCLKGCEEWGLFYAEYHLHDKDGRTVRINRKKSASDGPEKVQSAGTETIVRPPVASTMQTVTVYRTITTVQEGDVIAANPLLWALVVLLLLFLILRRTRRGPQEQ